MKKALLTGFAVACFAAIPIGGYAAQMPQTIDAPHVNVDSDANTEDCAKCHFSSGAYTCIDCHNKSTAGGYSDTSAPFAQSHFNMACTVCHNPHVSLQYGNDTALVQGIITGVNETPANATEFTVSVSGGTDSWETKLDPAAENWTAKTFKRNSDGTKSPNIDRGLIFWTKDSQDSYSFEVNSVVDNGGNSYTLTVQGDLPEKATANVGSLTTFELHFGQLIARAVNPSVADYRSANATLDAVTFPATGNTGSMAGNHLVTSVGDGICQKCHTATTYWLTDGSGNAHNADKPCTSCHTHQNDVAPAMAFGLGADCAICHPNYPAPPSSGAHQIHAGSGAGEYNFQCRVCHKGGMESWDFGDKKDGLVQLGFNLIPNGTINFSGANTSYDGATTGTLPDAPFGDATTYGTGGYEGQNDTTVSTGGTMTCSNIYCHSDGYASGYMSHDDSVAGGARCTTSTATSRSAQTQSPNVTFPWDATPAELDTLDPDGNKCNNCHDVNNAFGSIGWNGHVKHGMFCNQCHYATVNVAYPEALIANTQYHANGNVDILMDPALKGASGSLTYDPTTNSCTMSGVGNCHNDTRVWPNLNRNSEPSDDVTCETVAATANVDPVQSATCYNVTANTFYLSETSYDLDYLDPVKAAAYGGHTGNDVSWLKINWFNMGGNDWQWQMMTDRPANIGENVPAGFAFTDTFLAANNNEIWVTYDVLDNSGQTLNNHALNTRPGGGWERSGWFMCDYGAYDAATNDAPIMDFTTSTVNATTMRLTDRSIDIDWNDSVKNTANGCGNDGSNAQIKITWHDDPASGTATNAWIPMTDTPVDRDYDHTFDPAYIFGGSVWYQYKIKDNTLATCGTGVWAKSGWRQHQLQ